MMSNSTCRYSDRLIKFDYSSTWHLESNTERGWYNLRIDRKTNLTISIVNKQLATTLRRQLSDPRMPPQRERIVHRQYRLGLYSGIGSEVLFYNQKKKLCGYGFSFIEEGELDGLIHINFDSSTSTTVDEYDYFFNSIRRMTCRSGIQHRSNRGDKSNSTLKHMQDGSLSFVLCDGGPHLLLPDEYRDYWKGVSNTSNPIDIDTDYGRACALAIPNAAVFASVGNGQAVVIGGSPAMTASVVMPETGELVIFLPCDDIDEDVEELIYDAFDDDLMNGFKSTDNVLFLKSGKVTHMYAGDVPNYSVYGEIRLSVPAGRYRMLNKLYVSESRGSVAVYKFARPKKAPGCQEP